MLSMSIKLCISLEPRNATSLRLLASPRTYFDCRLRWSSGKLARDCKARPALPTSLSRVLIDTWSNGYQWTENLSRREEGYLGHKRIGEVALELVGIFVRFILGFKHLVVVCWRGEYPLRSFILVCDMQACCVCISCMYMYLNPSPALRSSIAGYAVLM